MKRYIFESELIPKGNGMEAGNVVLCQTAEASDREHLHPFVTWLRIHPEDRPPYNVSGHYFGANELKEAVEDFEDRCAREGVKPYPRTGAEANPPKECPGVGVKIPMSALAIPGVAHCPGCQKMLSLLAGDVVPAH